MRLTVDHSNNLSQLCFVRGLVKSLVGADISLRKYIVVGMRECLGVREALKEGKRKF